MLKKRIIPCLDIDKNTVVKGTQFLDLKTIGSPIELAKYYEEQGADELVFYDITASIEKRNLFENLLKTLSKEISIPLCVGGGINTLDDFKRVLNAGADKVSINTAAIKTPNLINNASEIYGNQCVVVSMDIKKINNQYFVFTGAGKNNTYINAIKWAEEVVQRGAGELVINAIHNDGMKQGFDIELMDLIGAVVNVPLIASGGAGRKEDFYKAFCSSNISGALAASIFHNQELPIPNLKKYLIEKQIPIRYKNNNRL